MPAITSRPRRRAYHRQPTDLDERVRARLTASRASLGSAGRDEATQVVAVGAIVMACALNDFDLDIKCLRLKPHVLDGKVLLNIEQIIPVPEAADYQVRIRQKEKEERQVRSQDRDTTRFQLKIGQVMYDNLPKRKLAFQVIRAAVQSGARPTDVVPLGRAWIVAEGTLSASQFEQVAEDPNGRTAESSTSEVGRFFTAEDELFHIDAKTYALTKMWGEKTLSIVNDIIARFDLREISYTAISDVEVSNVD